MKWKEKDFQSWWWVAGGLETLPWERIRDLGHQEILRENRFSRDFVGNEGIVIVNENKKEKLTEAQTRRIDTRDEIWRREKVTGICLVKISESWIVSSWDSYFLS